LRKAIFLLSRNSLSVLKYFFLQFIALYCIILKFSTVLLWGKPVSVLLAKQYLLIFHTNLTRPVRIIDSGVASIAAAPGHLLVKHCSSRIDSRRIYNYKKFHINMLNSVAKEATNRADLLNIQFHGILHCPQIVWTHDILTVCCSQWGAPFITTSYNSWS